MHQKLNLDLIYLILSFDGRFKIRNKELVQIISKADERYQMLLNRPMIQQFPFSYTNAHNRGYIPSHRALVVLKETESLRFILHVFVNLQNERQRTFVFFNVYFRERNSISNWNFFPDSDYLHESVSIEIV